jgi:hypothetical protein
MTDLEIPHEEDRHFVYRFFEILPGALSWLMLFMPLILSLFSVTNAYVHETTLARDAWRS